MYSAWQLRGTKNTNITKGAGCGFVLRQETRDRAQGTKRRVAIFQKEKKKCRVAVPGHAKAALIYISFHHHHHPESRRIISGSIMITQQQ
jgi:hypothetical protein